MDLVKRLFDLVVSIAALIVLLPLMIVVSLSVFFVIGRPVFFAQNRPGKNSQVFRMYKFRSMSEARSATGEYLPDEMRLGAFGNLLRSTSLDELPALWNVFLGDMSLVGPRPLLVAYLPLYSVEQARRHEVKPGITGWAQINGRNAITWNEKFKLDVWYVDNRNVWLDMKILLLTLKIVLIREGISSSESVTMEKFKG